MISKLTRPLTMSTWRSSGMLRASTRWPMTLSTALWRPMSSRSTIIRPSASKSPAACSPPVFSNVDWASCITAPRRLSRSTEMTISDCTGGGVAHVALQQHVHHVAVVGISVGAAIACDDVEIVGARDDALGEQEARDELLVVAWGSHRDAEIDTAQANLEGLFDGEIIQALGGSVIPNFDNAMPNGGNAPRNFQVRL